MKDRIQNFYGALLRKKPLDCRIDTELRRCLNLLDLTALGVGSTLGLGLYVLAGQAAANKSGPAVIVSFSIAALASAFSALCYAEFAGRVPKAGSAYAYSYITVGEFVAFIIGWNMLLEYVIGAASVARGFSGYIMFMVKNERLSQRHIPISSSLTTTTVANATAITYSNVTSQLVTTMATTAYDSTNSSYHGHLEVTTTSIPWMSAMPDCFQMIFINFDWLTLLIVFLATCFILYGVKESTNFTLTFTCVNIMVVLVAVISGLAHIDFHNWKLEKSELPLNSGEGGFMPYGWAGVLAGSATCFFGFIGFDTIASSAEEAKNPKRNVPLAILISLFISFLAYFLMAAVQTLIWPYYDQNKIAVLPYIFDQLDMPIAYWILLIGALAGLTSSQCGGLYPLPRIIYSMARDSIIYNYLAKIDERFKMPVRAAIVGSLFTGLLGCLLEIEELADMVSIGTLAAYSLVSLSVLILRYENREVIDEATISRNRISYPDITKEYFMERGTSKCEEIYMEMQQKQQQQQNCSNNLNQSSIIYNHHHKKCDLSKKDAGDCFKESDMTNGTGINQEAKSEPHRDPQCKRPSISIITKGSRPIKAFYTENGHNINIVNDSVTNKNDHPLNEEEVNGDRVTQRRIPTDKTSNRSKRLIAFSVVIIIMLDVVIYLCISELTEFNLEAQVSIGLLTIWLLIITFQLTRLPTRQKPDSFQVPLVPVIPFLSIFVNTFLMLNLGYLTWIRFSIWMVAGFVIYFTYGIWNSTGYLIDLD